MRFLLVAVGFGFGMEWSGTAFGRELTAWEMKFKARILILILMGWDGMGFW